MSGQVVQSIPVAIEATAQITFSPDGARLLTVEYPRPNPAGGFTESKIALWDLAAGKLIAELHPSDSAVACFSPDGSRIVTLYQEATLFDGKTGARIGLLEQPDRDQLLYVGNDLFFTPDSKQVIIRMLGPTPIRIHSTADGNVTAKQQLILRRMGDSGMQGAFSPDGKTFAFSAGRTLQWIDVATGRCPATPRAFAGICLRMWYGPDGRVFSLNADLDAPSTMKLSAMNPATGELLAQASLGFTDSPRVAIATDGTHFVVWSGDGIRFFDSLALAAVPFPARVGLGYSDIPFSPDGSRLAACGWSNFVALIDPLTGRITSTISDRSNGISGRFTDAVFINDDAHLLTATDTGTIRLWYRRRPEGVWGVIVLPCSWAFAASMILFLFSLRRDLQHLQRPSAAI